MSGGEDDDYAKQVEREAALQAKIRQMLSTKGLNSRGTDDWFEDLSQGPLRDPLVLREQVYAQLRTIIDPDLGRDIVSLGFIKELRMDYEKEFVAFKLELTTPACPVKDEFVLAAETRLKELSWVSTVEVTLTAREQKSYPPGVEESAMANLKNVSRIIAVASCKGGVGKSTVAVNLAYMLARSGAAVGLCDCDIYGPSLPILIDVKDPNVYFQPREKDARKQQDLRYEEGKEDKDQEDEEKEKEETRQQLASGAGGLSPLVYGKVKLMSYGFIKSTTDYAAIRGPMASSVIYQLVTQTLWGPLDYLVLDLPPGTGDVHLTIAQSVPIAAAVMVTTPHKLSTADVRKGIKMFAKVNIPTVALVENMAVFSCSSCGASHELFRKEEQQAADDSKTEEAVAVAVPDERCSVGELQEEFGVQLRSRLPFDSNFAATRFRKNGQLLYPFVNAFDSRNALWREIQTLCDGVVREVSKTLFAQDLTPDLRSLDDGLMEFTLKPAGGGTGSETVLLAPARAVRLACRCAECVDEHSGRSRINSRKIPVDVHPQEMHLCGNYAARIEWSDGHSSLMGFAVLEAIFRESAAGTAAPACAVSSGADDW